MILSMQLIFKMILIIGLWTSSVGLSQDFMNREFCQDKLNEQIKKLIAADDSEILMNSFNLASLKLAYKVLDNGGERKTLEAHAKEKAKELTSSDKMKLRKKVTELYKKFGKSSDLTKINSIVDQLGDHNYFPKSERLSNEDASVFMMAYEMMDPCTDSSLCIDDNDTSIVWFMEEVANKVESDTKKSKLGNLLRSTVKVAHNTGVFSNTMSMSLDEVKDRVKNLQKENRNIIKKFNDDFRSKYDACIKVLGGESCFAQSVNEVYQNNLNEILNNLGEQQIKNVPGSLKVKLAQGLTFNLGKNLVFKKIPEPEFVTETKLPKKVNLPLQIVEGDRPFTCGGESFQSETTIKRIWSFDPMRLWSNIKNFKRPWKEADRLSQRKRDAVQHKADSNNKGAKLMAFFNNLCPRIPISMGVFSFKCSPFMKWIVLRNKIAQTNVCCNDKVEIKEFSNLFAGSTGGIEGKVFVGIPYLAEFGGIVGLSGTLNLGGGGIPENCYEKKCIQGALILSVYGGLYLDIGYSGSKGSVKSAIGGEAKIAWKPYATARQCLYPTGNLPPAEVKLSLGSIWVQGTVYAGWVFSTDFYKKLWESKKEDTFSVAIF